MFRERATHPWKQRMLWAHWDSVVTTFQIGKPSRDSQDNSRIGYGSQKWPKKMSRMANLPTAPARN